MFISNFFKNVANSIYSPSFYTSVIKKPFVSALGYFLLLTFVLTLIAASTLLFNNPLEKLFDTVVSSYPFELVIKIRNGEVVTNLKEPYFISLKTSPNEATQVVVIDTKTPFSVAAFNNYRSTAWLAKDTLFYRDPMDKSITTFDLSSVRDYTIDKTTVGSFIREFTYFKFVNFFLIGGILAIIVGRLIYLSVLLFVVWLFFKIIKRTITYIQTLKVGLHAITLGLIVESAISLMGWKSLPFMLTLITLTVIIVNVIPYKKHA